MQSPESEEWQEALVAGVESGGDEGQIQKARDQITQALGGHGYNLAFYSERDESHSEGLNLVSL